MKQANKVIAKTIMRKDDFKTPSPEYKFETIKKVDNKWVVYPKKGGDRLGTHDTKEKALKQLAAIEASKHENINERSSLTGGYGAEPGEPDTAWLTDGSTRKIDTTRPEYWFKQGGYKQIDFPKADWVRGKRLKDRDEDMTTRKVVYKVKNVKVSTLKPALQPYSVDDWKPIKEKKKKK
jgi:hypothetical protein